MSYEVHAIEVAPTLLASVRERVAWSQMSKAIPRLLDKVYAFLRDAPVKAQGHNVCVYLSPSAEGVELEAGVHVSGAFESTSTVQCSATPAGRAVWTVHMGEYQHLGQAYDALAHWCRAEGLGEPGLAWEVYGDWHDDPTCRRCDVYRLLK
jgi:effector-binding domain-containing protein